MGSKDLGNMGLSPLGLGTWAFGGVGWSHSWGDQGYEDSVQTVLSAVRAGMTWVDTAPAYGHGRAERIVGDALKRLSVYERPLISTKCGLRWGAATDQTELRKIMSEDSVRAEVIASMRRLGVNFIDMYCVHWPGDGKSLSDPVCTNSDLGTELETYWELLASLKHDGLVGAIGLSNHSVSELRRAQRVAPVDFVQCQWSVVSDSEQPQIEWALQNGVAIVAYQMLHSGLVARLGSTHTAAADPQDWRSVDLEYRLIRSKLGPVEKVIREISSRRGTSISSVAVGWALSTPGIAVGIVGARNGSHCDSWVQSPPAVLDDSELRMIDAARSALLASLRTERAPDGYPSAQTPEAGMA